MITKTHQDVFTMIEDQEKYSKGIGSVVKEIARADKDYILAVLDVINTVFLDDKYNNKNKYLALQLLKDCMNTGQHLFATGVAKCTIKEALEDFATKKRSVKDSNFNAFLLECIKLWAQKYRDTKDSTHKFAEVYETLQKQGIAFPSTYTILTKDEISKFLKVEIPPKAFAEPKKGQKPDQRSSTPTSQTSSQPSSTKNENNDSKPRSFSQDKPRAETDPTKGSSSSTQEKQILKKVDSKYTNPGQANKQDKKSNWEPNPQMQKLIDHYKKKYDPVMQETFFYNAQDLKDDEMVLQIGLLKPQLSTVLEIDSTENSASKLDRGLSRETLSPTPKGRSEARAFEEEARRNNLMLGPQRQLSDEILAERPSNILLTSSTGSNKERVTTPQKESIKDKPTKPQRVDVKETQIKILLPEEPFEITKTPEKKMELSKDLFPESEKKVSESNKKLQESDKQVQENDKKIKVISSAYTSTTKSIKEEEDSEPINLIIKPPTENRKYSFEDSKYKQEIDILENKNRELHNKNEELQKRLDEEMKKKKKDSDASIFNLEKEITQLKEQNKKLEKTLAQQAEAMEKLTEEMKNKDDQITQLTSLLQKSQKNLDFIAKENQEVRNELELARETILLKTEENNRLQARLDKIHHGESAADSLAKENKALKGEIAQLTEHLQEKEQLIQQHENEIKRLRAELQKKEAEFKTRLEETKRGIFEAYQAREKEYLKIIEQKDKELAERDHLGKDKDETEESTHYNPYDGMKSETRRESLSEIMQREESEHQEEKRPTRDQSSDTVSSHSRSAPKKERVFSFSKPKESRTSSGFYKPNVSYRNTTRYNGTKVGSFYIDPLLSPNAGTFLKENLYSTLNIEDIISPKQRETLTFRNILSPSATSMGFYSPHPAETVMMTSGDNFFSNTNGINELPDSITPEDFRLSCIRDRSILYDSFDIGVECYSELEKNRELKRHELLFVFIYRNKTGKELEDFEVTYKNTPGFKMSADDSGMAPRILPNQQQVHVIHVKMIGPIQSFGHIIVQYKLDNELKQIKLKIPLIITKFMAFKSISAMDFTIKRKQFLFEKPGNYVESPKIRLTVDNFDDLKNNLLSKMTVIPVENKRSHKFTLLGGQFSIDTTDNEFFLRVIIENDTRLAMFQLTYESDYKKYAERIIKMLNFIANEKVLV